MDITSKGRQSWCVTRLSGLRGNSVASVRYCFWRTKSVLSSISKKSHLNNKLTGNGIVLPLIYVDIFSCHIIIIASCPVVDSIKNGIITHATLEAFLCLGRCKENRS